MAITALEQRALDLLHAGHTISEIDNLLGVKEARLQAIAQDVTQKAVGLPAPADVQHRAVDLAYAGHPISEIANLTGMSENAVRAALQDTTKVPAVASSPLSGVTSTVAPAAGGAGALPATPLGYLSVLVNGVARKVPYY